MTQTEVPTAVTQAGKRARYLTGLLWHVGAFIIINASFWILGAWAFALAFHLLTFLIDGRQLEDRKTRQHLV